MISEENERGLRSVTALLLGALREAGFLITERDVDMDVGTITVPMVTLDLTVRVEVHERSEDEA